MPNVGKGNGFCTYWVLWAGGDSGLRCNTGIRNAEARNRQEVRKRRICIGKFVWIVWNSAKKYVMNGATWGRVSGSAGFWPFRMVLLCLGHQNAQRELVFLSHQASCRQELFSIVENRIKHMILFAWAYEPMCSLLPCALATHTARWNPRIPSCFFSRYCSMISLQRVYLCFV
jgi:hypothetical protein